jgi:hypothetical protein
VKNLTATICLTITLLLGSVGASWSADWDKGVTAYKSGDYATALREWTPLATRGDASMQYLVGTMHKEGKGTPQDYKTAVKWWRLAAEQGNADAQSNLGWMYRNGKGVPQDYKTAVKWYTLAAEQGDASAQTQVEKLQKKISDQNELRELQVRAKQGNADAQYNLGLMYDKGRGVPQNYKTAVKWYTLAAKQGHADAQYNLGVMYDEGIGISQNNYTAMKWYGLAAKRGNSDAQKRYGELVLQDFVYESDIRELKNLGKTVKTLCKRNIKCAFDKVWAYLDISKDGRLSLAEIARFQRNIVKFAAVGQDKNVLKTEEIAAINLASIIFLPITASSILHSFDYNNDGVLSKNEVFGDTEFSKLVGVNVNTLATGLDFQSLGKQLKDFMGNIPFLK